MVQPGRAKLLLFALLVAPAVVAAQGRVGVRPVPKPGEAIRVTTKQEVLLRVGGKPEEPGPAYMHFKSALTFTQANGAFGPDDKLDAEISVEALEVEEAFGGQPRPLPDMSNVKGRKLVVTVDRTGKLLSIKVPPDMREISSRLTQLLAGAYGMVNFLPAVELAAGQETVHTTELPMRLPGNISQGPLQARTTLTMRALDKLGTDRVAHLQQDIAVVTGTSQLQMSGGGTIDVNVDRGFVSGTDVEWKISGEIPTGNAQSPSAPFHGSIKISLSAN